MGLNRRGNRGKPSWKENLDRFTGRQLVYIYGYHDDLTGEIDSRIEIPVVMKKVQAKYPFNREVFVHHVELGEVIKDSRGEGSFQRQTQ